MMRIRNIKYFIIVSLLFLSTAFSLPALHIDGTPSFPAISFYDFEPVMSTLGPALNKTGSFTSSLGLEWELPYIGPFINTPPNWGFALTFGLVSIDTTGLSQLARLLGRDKVSPLLGNTAYFPMDLFEFRIGGSNTIKFDAGLKFGILPNFSTNLLLLDSGFDGYRLLTAGADIRFNIIGKDAAPPELSIGLEGFYGEGAFIFENVKKNFYVTPGTVGADDTRDPNAAGIDTDLNRLQFGKNEKVNVEAFWESLELSLKVDLAKTWGVVTIFGGGEVGVALIKNGGLIFNSPGASGGALKGITRGPNAVSDMDASGQASLKNSLEDALGADRVIVDTLKIKAIYADGPITNFAGFEDIGGNFGVDSLAARFYVGLGFRAGEHFSISPSFHYDVFANSFAFNLSFKYLRQFWDNSGGGGMWRFR